MKTQIKRNVSGRYPEETSRLSRAGEELVMAFENWLLNCEDYKAAEAVGQEPTDIDLGLAEDQEEKLEASAESRGLTKYELIAQIVRENLSRYGKPLLSQKRQS